MPDAALTILADEKPVGTISPLVHGHFAEHIGRCVNDGLWVGEGSPIPNDDGLRSDVLAAMQAIALPFLRWPGGCYADTYHWRDGIGPRAERPRTLGESCGLSVVEDNGMGTHEFIRLCRAIGAEPYLAGNVGSGSPQEMMDWVHYCNGTLDTTLVRQRGANGHSAPMNVRYWGVGNENWECGGSYDATQYGKEFRRYATFLKQIDSRIELVACGDNVGRRDWNLRVVEAVRDHIRLLDHLSIHRYYGAGHATDFNEDEYYQILRGADLVEEDIRETAGILRYYTRGRRKVGIAVDEWGVWHPQAASGCDYEAPSTLRDAVSAAGVLDVLHRHADVVSMANIAQIVNVLQALIQTQGDRMWLTPTYHVFAMYAAHRGAESLRVELTDCPMRDVPAVQRTWPETSFPSGVLPLVSASASRRSETGAITLSVTNRRQTEPMNLTLTVRGEGAPTRPGTLQTLTAHAPNAVNTAQEPNRVTITTGETPPASQDGKLTITLPPCSVQTLTLAG